MIKITTRINSTQIDPNSWCQHLEDTPNSCRAKRSNHSKLAPGTGICPQTAWLPASRSFLGWQSKFATIFATWWFPKIGLPLNHPFSWDFR